MKLHDLKPNIITESCSVMGMFKLNFEIKNNKFVFEDLGEYEKVDYSKIKRKITEQVEYEEPLVDLMDISLDTGRTKFSAYFYDKAVKICEVLGQDFDFEVYECVEGSKPVVLVNQNGTAFIIAPRVEPKEEYGG